MSTKLGKTIRREIDIDGEPFTLTISPHGVRLTRKRFRSGMAVTWKSLWDGQHATLSGIDPSAAPNDP